MLSLGRATLSGLAALGFLASPFLPKEASALSLIRDSEIETTIRTFSTPLFEAGGLNPDSVRIYLVADDQLNAFVAGGMNMFLNTGLLRRADNANQLIGVIAHETGHITGGHLTQLSQRLRTASSTAMVSTILGILAGVATGSGEAGAAIIQGGQGLAMDSLLGFSRAQESAADQTALLLLDRTGQSSRGMRDFLRKLEDQELMPPSRQDAYLRTHPLTRDRIEHVESHLSRSPLADAPDPPHFETLFKRMQAKLQGFMDSPTRTLSRIPEDAPGIEARYTRAIALFRLGEIDRALPVIETLIAEESDNPYFHELKGQMLFEHGRIADALEPYQNAMERAPDAPLIRLALARVQIALDDRNLLEPAIRNLLRVTAQESDNAFAWDQLAVAYGRDEQFGLSALASAEAAMARGLPGEALDHVTRGERRIQEGSPGWLRLQDIRSAAEQAQRGGRR